MQRNIIVQELLYLQRTATSALAELYSVVCMVGIGETGEIVQEDFDVASVPPHLLPEET